MRILVAGASGYIGSHTCLALLGAGHQITGLDHFCNCSPESLRRVERIAERRPSRASKLLNWSARRGLEDMCRNAWRWQKSNPSSYPKA